MLDRDYELKKEEQKILLKEIEYFFAEIKGIVKIEDPIIMYSYKSLDFKEYYKSFNYNITIIVEGNVFESLEGFSKEKDVKKQIEFISREIAFSYWWRYHATNKHHPLFKKIFETAS